MPLWVGQEEQCPFKLAGLHWFDLFSHTFFLYVCVCLYICLYIFIYLHSHSVTWVPSYVFSLVQYFSFTFHEQIYTLIKRIFRFWWGRRIKSLKVLCSLLKIQHLHIEDKEGRKRTWKVKSGSLVTFSPFEPESLEGRMTLNHESKHLLSFHCQLGTTMPSIS